MSSSTQATYEVFALKYAGPFDRKLAMTLFNTGWAEDIAINYYTWAIRAKSGETTLVDTGTGKVWGPKFKGFFPPEQLVAAEKITDHDAEQLAARLTYAQTLEQKLYSQGIDAYVQATGEQHDTLQISWEAISLPIVHSMMNSPGILSEAPSLGFKRVIFTDGGRFSKSFGKTWAYSWDGESWTLR